MKTVEHRIIDRDPALGYKEGEIDDRAEDHRHGPGQGDDPCASGGPGHPGKGSCKYTHYSHDKQEPLIAAIAEDQGNAGEGLDYGVETAVAVVLHVQRQGRRRRQEEKNSAEI